MVKGIVYGASGTVISLGVLALVGVALSMSEKFDDIRHDLRQIDTRIDGLEQAQRKALGEID